MHGVLIVACIVAFGVWVALRIGRTEIEPVAVDDPAPDVELARCSHLGCPRPAVHEIRGFPLCTLHFIRTTTREGHPMPMQGKTEITDDGRFVNIRPEFIPAVAREEAFTSTLSLEDVEDLYVRMRSRSLGAGARGDL